MKNLLSRVRVEPAPTSDSSESSTHSERNGTVFRRQISRAPSAIAKSIRTSAVLDTSDKLRTVPIMPGGDETDEFCNNAVSTSKYTLVSFLPKSIFEQFRRLANVYFLIISIFQVSTDLSPTSKFATILPLMCVIGLTVAKEAFEDWKRHVADQRVNTSLTTIVDPKTGSLRKVLCEDIRVGDIIQIHDRDIVQADGVLLSTCDTAGFCYIETSGLDGETNLKIRKAVSITKLVHKPKHWRKLNGCVKCEKPNANIYRFQGYMELFSTKLSILQPSSRSDPKLNNSSLKDTSRSNPPLQQQQQQKGAKEMKSEPMINEKLKVETERIQLHNDNLLLRGSVLRNTPRAFLLVVYTGSDTKQRQNTNDTPSKRSHVDRLIDRVILLIFISLMLICIISTALVLFNTNSESNRDLWYIPFVAEASIGTQMTSFITFLILFNNLVPISLYVSIEIVKLMQARLIESDLRMYHEPTSTAALVRSSGLNEDLGQIEYVFSDKTGTLTQNSMKFKRLSVIGYVYNSAGDGANMDRIRFDGNQAIDVVTRRNSSTMIGRQEAVRSGTRLTRYLRQKREHYALVRDMLRIMSVCNTVVPERVIDQNGGTMVRMQSASPDEEALVKGAHGYGFELLSRDENALILKEINEIQKFEILNVLEFSSDRRCMSMIVRTPEDTIEIYCKGADDVLFSRLSRPERGTVNPAVHNGAGADGKNTEEDSGMQRFQKETLEHLHWFAVNGLRTLVFAKAQLDLDFYEDWNRRFQNAQLLVEHKEAELSMLAAEVENELTLVGATAIEDLLQVGVPNAIGKLLSANIKVWMLTGDRMETSINIGLACNLINASMNVIRFGFESEGLMMSELAKALNQVYGSKLAQKLFLKFSVNAKALAELMGENIQRLESKVGCEDSNEDMWNETERSTRHAIVVDGRALTLILQDDLASTLFFNICNGCTAVIACRVSPRQKASLVRMVKEHVSPTPMTLAIGDGANDVGMLQEAHIGIGITGNEGAQAVRSSDYAIAQFRFLNRLLLVHGNWNYRRITKVILYSFYKNIVNVLTLFYYCFYNGFSGTTLYESWLSAGWNVGWTLFPVIVFGVLDRDLSPDTLFTFPLVYMRGQRQQLFNFRVMALWVLNAVVHSLIVFFISMSALANDVTASNGQTSGLWSMGTTVNGCMVLVVNLKIALESAHWTAYYVQSILFSIALWFVFVHTHSEVLHFSDYAHIASNLHAKAHPWFLYLLVPISAILVDLSFTYLNRMYRPSPVQIAREFEHLHKLGYVQTKVDAEFTEVEGNDSSTHAEASHITNMTNNIFSNTNAIRSSFAFSYPTIESGLRRHDEKEYDESGAPLTEEQSTRKTNKKPKKHKKKHNKKHRKHRQPFVIINGPTVEELAYFEDQMWCEEQERLEKAKG